MPYSKSSPSNTAPVQDTELEAELAGEDDCGEGRARITFCELRVEAVAGEGDSGVSLNIFPEMFRKRPCHFALVGVEQCREALGLLVGLCVFEVGQVCHRFLTSVKTVSSVPRT